MNFIESIFQKKIKPTASEKHFSDFLKLLDLTYSKRNRLKKEIKYFTKNNSTIVSFFSQAYVILNSNKVKGKKGIELEVILIAYLKLFVEIEFEKISSVLKKTDIEIIYQFNLFRKKIVSTTSLVTPRVFDLVYNNELGVVDEKDKKIYHNLQIERKDLMKALLSISKSN